VEFSSHLSGIYTKWGTPTFPPIFGLFAIFDRHFAKIVAPPSDGNKNFLAPQRASEKKMKTASKSLTITVSAIWRNEEKYLFKVCCPRTNRAPVSERDKQKQRTYSRRALIDLPKLCIVIEDAETIKKV